MTRSAPLAAPVGLTVDEEDAPVFEAGEELEDDFDPAVVDAGLDEDEPPAAADVAPPPRGAVERPSISLWTVALKVPVMLFSVNFAEKDRAGN